MTVKTPGLNNTRNFALMFIGHLDNMTSGYCQVRGFLKSVGSLKETIHAKRMA